MGVVLDDPAINLNEGAQDVEEPSLSGLGDVNERAYGDTGMFGPLICELRDDRARVHGIRENGTFVCVAMTFTVGDDVGMHFVATDADCRRRGLASRLLIAVMAAARADGIRSATLSASSEGLSFCERLGFRRVATLRGYLRPMISASLSAEKPGFDMRAIPDMGRSRGRRFAQFSERCGAFLNVARLIERSTIAARYRSSRWKAR